MLDLLRILSFAIILLPLIYWEVPKVWSYLIFINLYILYILYLTVSSKIKVKFKTNSIVGSLVVFIIVSLVSSLVGIDVVKSFAGNYYRSDGLITFIQLFGFAYILSSFFNDDWKYSISFAVFCSGIVSVIWNNFGQINFLVGFLLTVMPFGLYIYQNSKSKFAKLFVALGYILFTIRILTSSSYIGLFGIAFFIPIWLVIDNKKLIKFLLLPIVLGLVFTVYFYYRNEITSKNEYVAENRVRVYRNIVMGTLQKPILGYGWANTNYAFESVEWPVKFNDDIYVDKAHSLILEVFATTGLIGLMSYLVFLFLLVKKLLLQNDNWSKLLLTSLVMYFIYALTNVTSISQEFIFWLIVGMTI